MGFSRATRRSRTGTLCKRTGCVHQRRKSGSHPYPRSRCTPTPIPTFTHLHNTNTYILTIPILIPTPIPMPIPIPTHIPIMDAATRILNMFLFSLRTHQLLDILVSRHRVPWEHHLRRPRSTLPRPRSGAKNTRRDNKHGVCGLLLYQIQCSVTP